MHLFLIHFSDFARYSSQHNWVYFKDMNRDECLLIKQWDSEGGIAQGKDFDFHPTTKDGMSNFSIHSAFLDPIVYKNSSSPPPRESIEVRCICIW